MAKTTRTTLSERIEERDEFIVFDLPDCPRWLGWVLFGIIGVLLAVVLLIPFVTGPAP